MFSVRSSWEFKKCPNREKDQELSRRKVTEKRGGIKFVIGNSQGTGGSTGRPGKREDIW